MNDRILRLKSLLSLAIIAWCLFCALTGGVRSAVAQSAKSVESGDAVSNDATLEKTSYQFNRLHSFDDERWFFLGLGAAFVVAVLFVWFMYRRDAVELSAPVRWFLLLLRVTAFALVVLFYLEPERRTQHTVVKNSRVLVLVDTSSSMSRKDKDSRDGAQPTEPQSRIDPVVAALENGSLLGELHQQHDLTVIRFNQESSRIVSVEKFDPQQQSAASSTSAKNAAENKNRSTDEDTQPEASGGNNPDTTTTVEQRLEGIDWAKELAPHGTETRLGDAVRTLLRNQSGGPVAGIVVLSDGAQNAGVEVDSAIQLAKESRIPIYTIGLGSNERPKNVRLTDLSVPQRAFPADGFTITGVLQATGFAGRSATVELVSRPADQPNTPGLLVESQTIALPNDGELTEVRFEAKQEEAGRYTYEMRVKGVSDDDNDQDNLQQADIDIASRKMRVLLLAGGPTREYRFLRNQLRRDKDMTVDVLLQTMPTSGPISQDADNILDDFPTSKEELFDYDCLVAFDPDWTEFDAQQIDLLERWVGEEAGGLVVVAGPVYTGEWSRRTDMNQLLNLYPVQFQRRISLLEDDRYGSVSPRPLAFTLEGVKAQFLWIDDSALTNEAAWEDFPGVYGYYAVKGAKPGATVYAHFNDAEDSSNSPGPVYFASHYYGAGRVFYSGSGEMWRLRALDESHFEKFYTKLLRQVSQGRLLRGASNGALLIERDKFFLGDTVVIRAQLSDAQHDPLKDNSVTAAITLPDKTTKPLVLKLDPTRAGFYQGDFPAMQEGLYQIDLPVPESIDQHLSRRVEVIMPQLEEAHPERNDALLSAMAGETGGLYYVGLDAALRGGSSLPPIASQIETRAETTILDGAPDKAFQQKLMTWLLAAFCTVLCLEWLIRRLSKLA